MQLAKVELVTHAAPQPACRNWQIHPPSYPAPSPQPPGNCSHSSKQYTQCPYLEKYRILFTVYKKRVHFSPKSNKCSLNKMQKLRKVKMKTKINNYMHPLQGSTINTYLCSVLSFLMKLFYIMDIFFNTAIITCYLPFNFLLNHRYFDIITLMYNINFT